MVVVAETGFEILDEALTTINFERQLELSSSQYNDVREALASNSNLHSEIQLILSKDKNEDVRGYLSTNSALIPELFISLFSLNTEYILWFANHGLTYQNPKTQELLEKYLLLV